MGETLAEAACGLLGKLLRDDHELVTLIEGDKTQPVPKQVNAQSGNRPVTWKVRAGPTGEHVLKVTTSSGQSQDLPVRIKGEIFH